MNECGQTRTPEGDPMSDLLKQVVQPQVHSTRLIPLTRGQFAVVDAADYARVVALGKWYAAWSEITRSFYAKRNGSRRNGHKVNVIPLHSVILGTPPGQMADHINKNTLDYRRVNLRPCNQQQNQANRGPQKNNKAGFKGVHYHKQNGRWRATIKVGKRTISLGCFGSPEDAAVAYDVAARAHFGEFAYLNFPAGLVGASVTERKKKKR